MKKILLIFTLLVNSCSMIHDQEEKKIFLNEIQGTWVITPSGNTQFYGRYRIDVPVGTEFIVNHKGNFSVGGISFEFYSIKNAPQRGFAYYTVTL